MKSIHVHCLEIKLLNLQNTVSLNNPQEREKKKIVVRVDDTWLRIFIPECNSFRAALW